VLAVIAVETRQETLLNEQHQSPYKYTDGHNDAQSTAINAEDIQGMKLIGLLRP
jgi:hypothetical protein